MVITENDASMLVLTDNARDGEQVVNRGDEVQAYGRLQPITRKEVPRYRARLGSSPEVREATQADRLELRAVGLEASE